VPSRSAAVRTFKERQLLELLSNRLVAVNLSGYMFFGSSVLMSDKVRGAETRGLEDGW
jgi:hypothetical protein